MSALARYNALLLAAALVVAAGPARAQSAGRALRETPLLVQPSNGVRSIGVLAQGAVVPRGESRGAWVKVTVEGWLDQSVLAGKADTFPRSARVDGARIRAVAAANGRIVATLKRGSGLTTAGSQGTFFRVRRSAWVRRDDLAQAADAAANDKPAAAKPTPSGVRAVPATAADATPALVAAPGTESATPLPANALRVGAKGSDLRTSPDGRSLAALRAGAVVTPLAREKGWVRVRIEGWLPERDVTPADSGFRGVISAADLRADPVGTKGTLLRWRVEVLGLQTADALRRDLEDGEPYLLARGPDGEESLLYLALPPSLVAEARQLAPMSRVLVTARVRTGRSEPTGVPVLDVTALGKP